MTVKEIATKLSIMPEELERESLKIYLEHRLRHLESEIFKIGLKHNIKDIFEMEKLIQEGKIHEDKSWEDFFTLDNLQAEKKKVENLLQEVI